MFSGTTYILYNQKRYLIADTRKPLREKAMVRKTDSFICSSRRKVIRAGLGQLSRAGGRDKVQIGVGWGSGLHQRPQDSGSLGEAA